ncbi:MAG: hypothetical protein JSW26_24010 [Desulfobacterales bacterium]|nr:MAG: hypothetical protein JSW26_24010 [Desulfobacterales bacterium]
MKKLLTHIIVLALAITLGYGFAFAGQDQTGNGAPSGAHYNLNIIGVPKDKTADMTGNNGHRIFVKLTGKAKIWLGEGDDFTVIDANGTDGNGAKFELPNPDPDGDGVTAYSVFARSLGKPGGSSSTTTCFDAVVDDGVEEYCSIYSMVLIRNTGKSSFDNVSKELLYVYLDTDDDGVVERYSIFDDVFGDAEANYFWDYDNQGLKLVQLRFYEIPTTVPEQ